MASCSKTRPIVGAFNARTRYASVAVVSVVAPIGSAVGLRRAKELYPDTVRMVLSGYTELQSITDAVNEGAIYRFLTKPWDDERLLVHVREAFAHKELGDENKRLATEVVTASEALAAANERLEMVLNNRQQQIDQESARACSTPMGKFWARARPRRRASRSRYRP